MKRYSDDDGSDNLPLHCMNKVTAWMLAFLFWTLPLAARPSPHVLGVVAGATDTTLGNVTVPNTGTILNNDVLSTGPGGEALLEFFPAGLATVFKKTRIRFDQEGKHGVAHLISGAMTLESADSPYWVVVTSRYRIAPAGRQKTIYSVQVMPDRSIEVAVWKGRITITEGLSGPVRLLTEGQFASIGAPDSALPGQPVHTRNKSIKSPAGTWHIGSLSHRNSMVIATLAGAGVAAIAIPLSSGNRFASPSEP